MEPSCKRGVAPAAGPSAEDSHGERPGPALAAVTAGGPTVLALAGREAAAAGLATIRPDRAAAGAPDRLPLPADAPAPAPAPAAVPAPDPDPEPAFVAPALVPAARPRPRHWAGLASLILLVLLPAAAATGYLFTRAADQYRSEVGFSVRSEQAGAAGAAGLLGALTRIGGGSASDADILYDYIRSQEIVAAVDARLDLRAIWNRPGSGWRAGDPLFTLADDASIEALHRHWRRMVEVTHDPNTGLIRVAAHAFTATEAQAIAAAVLAESSRLVNDLAEEARADAVRFARADLDEAEAHLAAMRRALGDFRRAHNLVDPAADVAGQSGLVAALDRQLAEAMVARGVLAGTTRAADPRLAEADRRIAAITARIETERGPRALTGVAGSLPEVVGRYEALAVDLEFASQAYTRALAGLALARAEARRQSRYLAAHVPPTLATTALYPRRLLLAGLAAGLLLLAWSAGMLVCYHLRDR